MTRHLGNASLSVVHRLRQEFDAGNYCVGDRIPTERDLALRFGVARNTVRKALGHLEVVGYLERQAGRGTFVRQVGAADEVGPVDEAALSKASPADIMEVRLIIEPHAAGLAATRASQRDLDRIAAALRGSLQAIEVPEFERWDAALHRSIFEATKNQVLLRYCHEINAVRQTPAWLRLKQRSLTAERWDSYNRQHQELVAAIIARDPDEAQRLSLEHADCVHGNLLGIQ